MPSITSNAGDEPVALHYEDTGGEGRPVVLIHGWPLSGASWGHQVPALTEAGHRVITYDRRGFGRSDKSAGGYDYDTFAGDLAALLDGLDLREVALVGFSMGGGELARYVGRYGEERLRSLVFAAAVPPYLLKTEDNPEGGLGEDDVTGMQDGLRADRDGFLEGFVRDFFSAGGELRVSEADVQEAVGLAQQSDQDAALACISAFGRTDFRDDLAKVTVPTLVVHGDADAIVPVEVSGDRTAEAVAGAREVVVAGGPHGLNVSHAEEFNAALLDFLND